MSDVAAVAGVARSTVSNAIHRPHTLSPETLERVEAAMDHLGFNGRQRPSTGKETGKTAADSLPTQARIRTPFADTSRCRPASTFDDAVYLSGDPTIDLRWWGSLKTGDRVEISFKGTGTRSGTVDTLMPDGSMAWLWLDNGEGRVVVLAGDGFRLRPLIEDREVTNWIEQRTVLPPQTR